MVEGVFIAKENGVIAGLPVIEYFFSKLDKNHFFKPWIREGEIVCKGEMIAAIQGSAKVLLSGERIALNFLQRLSGIATLTSKFVERIKPLKTSLMDTRKTIPGWRYLEKYAVAVGGGVNQRRGLYDQVLIKDNHLDIMKDKLFYEVPPHTSIIEKATSILRQKIKKHVLVEVYVDGSREGQILNCLSDTEVREHMKDLDLTNSAGEESVRCAAGTCEL